MLRFYGTIKHGERRVAMFDTETEARLYRVIIGGPECATVRGFDDPDGFIADMIKRGYTIKWDDFDSRMTFTPPRSVPG